MAEGFLVDDEAPVTEDCCFDCKSFVHMLLHAATCILSLKGYFSSFLAKKRLTHSFPMHTLSTP